MSGQYDRDEVQIEMVNCESNNDAAVVDNNSISIDKYMILNEKLNKI